MKKNISVTGKNGTFHGYVEIKLNYRRETKTVNNRVTHDDELKTFNYHIVKGFCDGKEVASSIDFVDRGQVLYHAGLVEKTLTNYLTSLANSKPSVNVEDELKARGYN